jgi:archaellum biogenesis protein FlaJ (TadC family)
MSTNPLANATAAAGYISLLVTLIFSSPQFMSDNELGMIAPVIFLSLFVISAALMGYLFVYPSVKLLIEGKSKEATTLFLSTVAAFALIIAALVCLWLLISRAL